MKSIRINAVIATHGRCDLLERTLDSLAAARKPPEFESVLVVENGSDDGSRKICERNRGELSVRYHHLAEHGKSRALQWALGELRDGFVVFFDDDIRVCKDFFERYSATIKKHNDEEGFFYGGPLHIDYEGDPPPEWIKRFMPPSVVGWHPADPDNPLSGEHRFWGGNYGAYVKDAIAAGGFDPNIGPGSQRAGTEGNPTGQEFEFQTRLLLHGCKPVFVTGADVWHFVPHERCTIPWLLHRIYRSNLTQVIMDPDLIMGSTTICGAPLWHWRKLVQAAIGATWSRLLIDPERRFMLQRRYYRALGKLRGYQMRARMKAIQ